MNNMPERYDMESEVVVVGYGAAGSVAAITAHDHGASVLLLEKMPEGVAILESAAATSSSPSP